MLIEIKAGLIGFSVATAVIVGSAVAIGPRASVQGSAIARPMAQGTVTFKR